MEITDVDVNQRIEEQLKSHDVLLYMKGTPDFPQCGFSGQTVAALKSVGQPFAFVNIFEDPEIREGLKTY
ncbi:MAG: glutaredoxin domain-containing protein, partial [Pseudomonadota bacterium]